MTGRSEEAIVLAAAHLIPVVAPTLSPGWVSVRGGTIDAIGDGPPPRDLGEVHDYGEAALLPGLVNAHTHLGCAFLKGAADDSDFFEWITGGVAPRIVAAIRDDLETIGRWALSAAYELAAGGVTTVAESFLHETGREAMRQVGLRGVYYREYFGAMSEDLDAYVETARRRVESDAREIPDALVKYGLAPHSLYTCPQDVLRVLAAEALRLDLPVTIHLDESDDEHHMFAHRDGRMFDRFAGDGRAGRYRLGVTPTAVIADLGLLSPRTLLVHAVQITPDDRDRIGRSGASVVHCPSSNMRLGVGVAPIAELLREGVNVGLGTDSPASVGKLDMFEEMRLAVLAQRGRTRRADALTAADALAMATIGGARALGLGERIGALRPGAHADVIAVRLDRPRHRPFDDPVSALVWGATPDDVTATWVGGAELRPRAAP